jgi:glycosyltransferase involved in cell wall biosynthesis
LAERHLRHNPRTHLVRNVGEFSHFARAADQPLTPVELASVARPIIGFAGNLMASKVDFDLLDELAVSRPEWTILLIGPTRADATGHLRRLSQRANVRYISARPYAELPTYVAAFDVALIPYLANAYTRSCFPLKTYEYLAAGKPVVASGLPELAELAPHVELVVDHDGFVDAVERALTRTTEEEIEARRKIAAANTWETRTARLLQLITAELADGRLPVRDVATTLSR